MDAIRYALLVMICLVVENSKTSVSTARTKVYFPNTSGSILQTQLRSLNDLPYMDEFTVCVWVRFFGFINNSDRSIIFEVAQARLELVKLGVNSLGLVLTSNRVPGDSCFPSSWTHLWWHHICVTVFYPYLQTSIFINGERCRKLQLTESDLAWRTNFKFRKFLKIGSSGTGDGSKHWYGEIADLHVWDEMLSDKQVKEAARCRSERRSGNIFAWMKTPMVNFSVVFKETQLCLP